MARKLDDAGETVLGARKHDFGRALRLSDIDGISPEEAARLVVKDRVWPVPDWKALVESGATPEAIALVKIIRDRTPVQPNLDSVAQARRPGEAVRADFIRMVGMIRDRTEAIRTVEDAKAIMPSIFEELGWTEGNRETATRDLLATVAPRRRVSFAVNNNDIVRARVMVGNGFPDSVATPPWRRGVTLHRSGDGSVYARRNGILLDGYHDSEEAALAAVEAEWKERNPRRKDGPAEPPERARLDRLERHGLPDRRGGVDITPEAFIETFGFRGVQFGESMPDRERQEVLNMAFDALHDLAEVTGLPAQAISLNGFLAAAFGARGRGRSPAHYEPSLRIFNLGRLRGAGSLAHEWAHAFDHACGEIGRDAVSRGHVRYVSEKGGMHLPYDAALAWVKLMETVMARPILRDEALGNLHDAIAKAEAAIDRQRGIRDTLAASARAVMNKRPIAKIDKWIGEAEARRAALAARAEAVAAMPDDARLGEAPSEFYREAVLLCGKSGDYWKRPRELFARAFECAVHDRLRSAGARSDYLVHSVTEEIYGDKARWKGNPYPTGVERQLLEDAVFAVMEASVPLLDPEPAPSPTPM